MAATWRLRLQPSDPGWLDIALQSPLMDVGRAGRELGWKATHDSRDTLRELIAGFRDGAGTNTPPLIGDQVRGRATLAPRAS